MVKINNKTELSITANGSEIMGTLLPFFESLTITDKKGGTADSLNLELSDPHEKLAPIDTLKSLSIHINGVNKGIFEVQGVSEDFHGSISITGSAIKMGGNFKSLKDRDFDDQTIGSIVDLISKENGYTATVSDSLKGVFIGHINQIKESDLNLLTRLAKDNDAYFKPTHDRILFTNKSDTVTTGGDKLPSLILADKSTVTGRRERNKREQDGTVIARYLNEMTNLNKSVSVGSGQPETTLPDLYKSESEAMSAAKSALKAKNANDESLNINIPLNVDYVAGCGCVLAFGGKFDGSYTIEEMRHTVSVSGFDSTSMILKKPS